MTGEYHAHSHTHLHLHSQQQPEAGFQLPREFVFKKQKHKDRIKLSRNLNFISFEKCIVEIWDLFRDLNELFVFSFSNLSKFLFPSRFHVPFILYLALPCYWFDLIENWLWKLALLAVGNRLNDDVLTYSECSTISETEYADTTGAPFWCVTSNVVCRSTSGLSPKVFNIL